MNRETWTRSEPRTTHLETFISNSYIYLGNQVKETPKLGLKLKIVARTLRSAHFWIGPKYAGSDRVEDATWIFIAIVKITKNSLHQDEVFPWQLLRGESICVTGKKTEVRPMRPFYRIEQIPAERRPQCLNNQHLRLDIHHWTLHIKHRSFDIGKWTLDIGHWKMEIEQILSDGRS